MTRFQGVLFDYGHTLVDIRWGQDTLIEGQRQLLAALVAPPEALERFHADTNELLAEAERSAVDHTEIDYVAVTRTALARLGSRAARRRVGARDARPDQGVGQRPVPPSRRLRAARHAAGDGAEDRVCVQHARPAPHPARGDGGRAHAHQGRRDRAVIGARLPQAVSVDLSGRHRRPSSWIPLGRCLSAIGCSRMWSAPNGPA